MKLYIAGPMTGLPEYNLPAFARAKRHLDVLGYDAVNPGAAGVIDGYDWSDYMRDGLHLLLDCDGVALLPGWSMSRGVRVEITVAEALALDVRSITDW